MTGFRLEAEIPLTILDDRSWTLCGHSFSFVGRGSPNCPVWAVLRFCEWLRTYDNRKMQKWEGRQHQHFHPIQCNRRLTALIKLPLITSFRSSMQKMSM